MQPVLVVVTRLAIMTVGDVAGSENPFHTRVSTLRVRPTHVPVFFGQLNLSRKKSVFGVCPIARKTPPAAISSVVPSTVLPSAMPVTPSRSLPRTSSRVRFHFITIFGLARARCCMILPARSCSRRWTRLTTLANLLK